MESWGFLSRATRWSFLTIAALTACSGELSQAPIGLPAASRGESWMAPNLKATNLLYISDEIANTVSIYSYPQGRRRGMLTGFQAPHGECVDKAGNVFITNSQGHDILEYPHGSTKLRAVFDDANSSPFDCSVDATTGNLAVTNVGIFSSFEGSVAIYENASGSPTIYRDPNIYDYRYCGYDNRGNLFVDGDVEGPKIRFAELAKGSQTFTDITLDQSIRYPGGVLWDGAHVAVGDAGDASQDIPTIYQFAISGNRGTEVGHTTLDGSDTVPQFWIAGHTVIAPDSGGSGKVRFYRYPAGRSVRKVLSGFNSPAGAVVSGAP
jgi:hypothetical protein